MPEGPDSSFGLSDSVAGGHEDAFLRDEVGEDPDDSDYEDVEELFEEDMEDVREEEVELDGEAEVEAERGEEGAEKAEEVQEEVAVEKKVEKEEVLVKKDEELCVPKTGAADDGTKISYDSGNVVNHVSSTQKSDGNLSSGLQARHSTESTCTNSSKEGILPKSRLINRKVGKNKSMKKARHKKAYSKAHAVLSCTSKKPDGAVQHLDELNNNQHKKRFDASSAQTARRRPSSPSLGVDETELKKPATICDFFARGWCIKGSTCRFLHVNDGAAVTGSMGEIRKLKQPSSPKLLGSGSDEISKDTNVRQIALVHTYGGELPESVGSYNNYCQGTSATRPYHDIDLARFSSKEEYQYRQYLKEEGTYQEVKRADTHDAQFSRMSNLTSSSFCDRKYHSEGPSVVRNLYHSGSNYYTYGNIQGDYRAQYDQYHYPPYEYKPHILTSSRDSSYSNHHSSLHSSPSVHTFAQSVRPIHSSAILESEHGDIQRVDCHRIYDGSSYIPRISSPYYSKSDSRNSVEKTISGNVLPSIEQRSAVLDNTWETSVPFRSSFCNKILDNPFPGGQHDGVETQKFVASSTSHRSIDHGKTDQHVDDDLSGENVILGHGEPKPSASFSNRSYEDVFDKTSVHGVNSYPNKLSASRNGSIDEVGISISENKTHKIHNPHDDLSIMEREVGARVRNEVEKCSNNMESKGLRIFRVALVDFVKELVKPAWKDGRVSKDGHKVIVKKSVDKVIGTLQPHEVPSDAESINNFLSTSRPKVMKLVKAYVEKYAMYSSTEDNKLL